MRRPDNNRRAEVWLVCGSTGSGKSHAIKARIAREPCVMVFDVKNEYGSLPGFRTAHSRAEFVGLARGGGRVAWPATSPEDFEFFCRVVWARADCLVIVEELASVTAPGKACGTWHLIISQGRGFGIRTIGITQRPAEIDKTLVGNASLIRTHQLTRAKDRKYVADELDIDPQVILDLPEFGYVERDVKARTVSYGGPSTRRVRKP